MKNWKTERPSLLKEQSFKGKKKIYITTDWKQLQNYRNNPATDRKIAGKALFPLTRNIN